MGRGAPLEPTRMHCSRLACVKHACKLLEGDGARLRRVLILCQPAVDCLEWAELSLRYLIVKEVFWYERPRTLRGLTVGVRRLYLHSGVMNQVYATKNRVVKA